MSDFGGDSARMRCADMAKIGHLEELLANIFSKLPVKSVGACKCVSKHWLRLISELHFPALQLSWSRQKPKFIICPYPDYTDIITHLCLMDENGEITQNIPIYGFERICLPEMMCFLNGLICSVDEDHDDLDEVNIRIFNPFTRDTAMLPRGSPSVVVPSVGIAFDLKNNYFKAFRFFSDSSKEEDVKYKCEVYASGSKAWRMIAEDIKRPEHNPLYPFCPYYVSIDGSMYWFVWSGDVPAVPVRMLSVDMNDKFTEIDLPKKKLDQSSFLIELEGCLSVVHVDQRDDAKPHVEVYKFESHEWHLRAGAEMDVLDIISFNSVAAIGKNMFFTMRLVDESFCYLIFDLDERTWKALDLHDSLDGYSPVAFPFAESLVKCSGI